jgi:hypothetical protein
LSTGVSVIFVARDIVATMRRPVVLIVLAAALVAGCSSEAAEPEPLPRVSASASPAASPSPSAQTAVVPPAAQAETLVGASQFARFFYAEVDRAFLEKDAGIVRRLSDPSCKTCAAYAQSIDLLASNGETIKGASREILVAESPGERDGATLVSIVYNTPGAQRYNASDELIYEEPGKQGAQAEMQLIRRDGDWIVREITLIV